MSRRFVRSLCSARRKLEACACDAYGLSYRRRYTFKSQPQVKLPTWKSQKQGEEVSNRS